MKIKSKIKPDELFQLKGWAYNLHQELYRRSQHSSAVSVLEC